MDFSVILVVPWSAICTFIAVRVAAALQRPRPRLIWPFAFAVLTSRPVFVGLPLQSELHFWALSMFGLAIWAAIGTVIGGLLARLVLWTAGKISSD